ILTRDAFNVKVINKIYDEDAQQAYDKSDVPESTEDGVVQTLSSISQIRIAGPSHNESHVLATTGPHTNTLPWTDLNKTGSNLTDLATRQHVGLTDITANQHHVKYTDIEAILAIYQGDIPGSTDLNVYRDDEKNGYWQQLSNAQAASGSNYPVALAGSLLTWTSANGAMCTQTYTVYNSSSDRYVRTYYDGNWYGWKIVMYSGDKYTNANAVDAIEAVGIAAPVSTDWLIFSDAGILKKVAMSTLTPTIMTGLPKYTNVLARGAINNIIGADGKLDATLDCDGWGLSNVIIFALKENSLAYFQHFSAFATDHKFHGDVLSITTNGGSFGVPMYSNTTANRVSVCVDTSINTMPCIGIYVSNNLILTKGTIRDDTWNFTVGKPVYVNGSVFSTVIPPTVGDIVQVVGISLSADSMYFKPSLDWVVRK
ncbi:hypothetical protein LCGC14_1914350, partial [marine sediment metagenome]